MTATRTIRAFGSFFFRRFALTMIVWLTLSRVLPAERLPISSYTKADGLGSGEVHRIVPDSRGFLWFCTDNGLSWFDGYRFHAYNLENRVLSIPTANDMLESAGVYWVATNGYGVWRFEKDILSASLIPKQRDRGAGVGGASQVLRYPVAEEPATNRVNVLYKDKTGRLWAGTDGGLFRFDGASVPCKFRRVELHLASHSDSQVQVWALLADPDGSVWAGTKFGLARIFPDGHIAHYDFLPSQGTDNVYALLRDRTGRLWVGHQDGLFVFMPEILPINSRSTNWKPTISHRTLNAPPSLPTTPGEVQHYSVTHSSRSDAVMALFRASDESIWIGTLSNGAVEFDGVKFRMYRGAEGLSQNMIESFAEDTGGGLWMGTYGAMRLARNGFTSYGKADGLGGSQIASISEDREGELYVTDIKWHISRFEEGHLHTVLPKLPPQIARHGFQYCKATLVDHLGDWWLATKDGLCRFAKVNRFAELAKRSARVYRVTDGLVENDVALLYEDSRGDIWISYFPPTRTPLTLWQRSTGRFHHYSSADGLVGSDTVGVIQEDSVGNVWIGYRGGGFARYRNGKFEVIPLAAGDSPGGVRSIFRDHRGRLWAGTVLRGLIRIDNPQAGHPSIVSYTTANGLSSNNIRGITEDRAGRMYITSAHGIERIDPVTDEVRHFGANDGLDGFDIDSAFCDHHGMLWFAAEQSLLRLNCTRQSVASRPAVFISSLRISGAPYPIPDLGVAEVRGIKMKPAQNQIQLDFFGLSIGAGDPLRYQYKLTGGHNSNWSTPSQERSIDFANLVPGRYEFAVRAINADGLASARPATVSFVLAPPFWQRWWFLVVVGVIFSFALYAAHWYRVGRLLELERIRTRIATDLHDDIGSTLSQISVLSEVIRQRVPPQPGVSEPLSVITSLSRDLIDSLSDIVWAINPHRDSLADLVQRMRQFANDLFVTRDIRLRFHASPTQQGLKMGADMRREIFLVFKEAVNNISRHSACSHVDVEFAMRDSRLELQVKDDGQGFDPDHANEGNGLQSMQKRATTLGGTLEVSAFPGQGTTVRLSVPLRHMLRGRR